MKFDCAYGYINRKIFDNKYLQKIEINTFDEKTKSKEEKSNKQ